MKGKEGVISDCAKFCKTLHTYPDKKMLIKIFAFRVLLGLVWNSTSFIQIDALKRTNMLAPNQKEETRVSIRRPT